MSQVGELHKRMMRKMDSALQNLLMANARLENGAASETLKEPLTSAFYFLIEAQKLAMWIDTGETG